MANLKLNRWLIGIFTSIIVIFAMSYNASAADTVLDLSNYTFNRLFVRENVDCSVDGISQISRSFCTVSTIANHNVDYLLTSNSFSLKKGDILEVDLVIFMPLDTVNLHMPELAIVNNQIDSTSYRLLSFKDVSSFYSSDYFNLDVSNGDITGGSYVSKVIRYTFYVINDFSNEKIGFKTSNSTSYPIFSFYGPLNFKFINGNFYRPNANDPANAEQKKATEDAVDASEDAGDSSSSTAQSGSASLLNVIGAFAGIITSAQPTNCKINGNMGHLNIGQLDLCSNPVPSFVQIIGSIILVSLVIPFVVIMFNRFISIFRSFQS